MNVLKFPQRSAAHDDAHDLESAKSLLAALETTLVSLKALLAQLPEGVARKVIATSIADLEKDIAYNRQRLEALLRAR